MRQNTASRAAALILLAALLLSLFACAGAEKTYRLTTEGDTSRVITRFAQEYAAGEVITARAYEPENGYIRASLNGEELSVLIDGKTAVFRFLMPAQDAVLKFWTDETEGPITVPDLQPDGEDGGIKTITFVSINDTHGSIEQDEYGKGGLSNTKVAIDRMSALYDDRNAATTERDDVVLFAAGDLFQGQAVSNMTKGLAVVEAMNEMGFDGMTLGNHEFDWGLETVLAYWDGDPSNGEANFPLVISNITDRRVGKSLADLSEDDQIVSTAIVEKMGVRIGLIGVIGPCENSILAKMVENYRFELVASAVERAAKDLRGQGAQLIMVGMHYGNTDDPADLSINREIAALKDSSGDYLVDVLFNGHSHTRQKGAIARAGGAPLPIVQAGANNQYIGYITLQYDAEADAVSLGDYGYRSVGEVGTAYDKTVEAVVADYARRLVTMLPTLAVSGVTVSSKYDYAEYTAQVMLRAFGADYSCGNYGGLRGTGGVTAGQPINEANLYEVIPFDNTVYLLRLRGRTIYRIYTENEDNWYFGAAAGVPNPDELAYDDTLYTFAVIDYVYTGTYFSGYRSAVLQEDETGIILRDLLVADVKAHGDAGARWTYADGAMLEPVDWSKGG